MGLLLKKVILNIIKVVLNILVSIEYRYKLNFLSVFKNFPQAIEILQTLMSSGLGVKMFLITRTMIIRGLLTKKR